MRFSSRPSITSSTEFSSSTAESGLRVRSVMEEIWILINQAQFLIADVTGKNSNVFYELGIAHTLGKFVITITQDMKDVPFDIGHLRYIKYTNDKQGIRRLTQDIVDTVKNIARTP